MRFGSKSPNATSGPSATVRPLRLLWPLDDYERSKAASNMARSVGRNSASPRHGSKPMLRSKSMLNGGRSTEPWERNVRGEVFDDGWWG
jgi:hypothetical protein